MTQFKLKFYGSALGYLWQLMRPLHLFGVLYVVFSVALDFGKGLRFYLGLNLVVVVAVFAVVSGVPLHASLLQAPLLALVLVAFAFGISLLVSRCTCASATCSR